MLYKTDTSITVKVRFHIEVNYASTMKHYSALVVLILLFCESNAGQILEKVKTLFFVIEHNFR